MNIDQLKMERIDFCTQNHENIKRDSNLLAKIEQKYLTKLISTSCVELLRNLQHMSTPTINSTISLSFKSKNFMYKIPGQESARFIEAEASSSIVFSCMSCETFLEIYLSVLMEQPMVLVSSNPALLTSVILMFYSLLKPMKWPHPLISILPYNLIHILDSPIPIFVGLNMSKQDVMSMELCTRHEQCTFVFLDEHSVEISSSSNEVSLLIASSPLYSRFLSSTDKLYSKILPENIQKNKLMTSTLQNSIQQDKKKTILSSATDFLRLSRNSALATSSSSSHSDMATSSFPLNKKELLISPNDEQKKDCLNLMMTISNILQSEIIDHLPNKALVARGNVIDFELLEQYITCQKRENDQLLSRILKTQIFSYFAEEYYEDFPVKIK